MKQNANFFLPCHVVRVLKICLKDNILDYSLVISQSSHDPVDSERIFKLCGQLSANMFSKHVIYIMFFFPKT